MNECVNLVKIHHTTEEISEFCLNESAYGLGGGIGNATSPHPTQPQITSTGADFVDNKAAFLGQKAASADVVSGGELRFFQIRLKNTENAFFFGKVPLSRCANKEPWGSLFDIF